MKSFLSITMGLLFVLVAEKCEPVSDAGLRCQEITLNKPFTAKIGEEWCVPQSGWSINFGPVIEDSRCNVVNVECIWAGQFVMATTISNGEINQDTFYAINNWQDTLYANPFTIYLNKVNPEVRATTEPLDPASYSFEMVVR